ncbi:30S ribosomal protein S6 [Candidatus Kuenenbacteria bacterium]|nr:30S ribosomal protein S6 [Candidatus Kuenenbacteria bacterium]
MQLYDLLYIISNQLTNPEISSIKEQIESILQKNNGTIIKTIEIGRRKLSYPIKQNRYGVYFRVFFNLEPINSKKLNRDLRLNLNIIRYQIIKTKSFFVEKPAIQIPLEIEAPEEEKEEKKKKKEEYIHRVEKKKITLKELNEDKLDKILSQE